MITISVPTPKKDFSKLTSGDKVLLSGTIYTARDKAHRRIVDIMESGGEMPFELKDSVIYYCGPVFDKETGLFSSAGPTTASRMDSLTPFLLEAGVAAFIGKGPRSETVRQSVAAHQAVYLSTVGGAGVYLAERITDVEPAAFPEFGTEAVYKLKVENFPCYVAIDARGRSIFE